MRNKNYKMTVGNYYFSIKSGQQNITIYRNTETAARDAYENYVKVGKNAEWLGCWNGKKFVEKLEPAK